MRGRGRLLSRTPRAARSKRAAFALLLLSVGCKARPELRPDDVLKEDLGLTDYDEVHRIGLTGGDFERVEPREVVLRPGAYVEFRTADWRVHEVSFELDSLSVEARTFLEHTDQVASPPMLRRDSRFVVWFDEAPAGRYPFVVEGNTSPGRGAVVVSETGR